MPLGPSILDLSNRIGGKGPIRKHLTAQLVQLQATVVSNHTQLSRLLQWVEKQHPEA